MHAIFFGLKRSWHSSLRVTRSALAALGLTAARFDLLYALHRDPPRAKLQRDLRRVLGVNRTTVSRMITSLVALGLVAREPHPSDRRQRLVRLTPRGLSRIRLAIWRLIRTGAAQLAVDTGVGGERWHSEDACFAATSALDSLLRRMRGAFGDRATVRYPWHPDD